MTLQSTYRAFLAAPNAALMDDSASIHYITTLVTHNGSAEVIKHLKAQTTQLKKKGEEILHAIEGESALALEIETTIEFLHGGGAYLPGLDDNFLADRTVVLPIIHIVTFKNGKIEQIRLNWDQGSLLKLIDIIGKTGRNWPIQDGKDQIKLINSSVKLAAKHSEETTTKVDEGIKRSRENSTNVTRDPHASLSLFAPRDEVTLSSLPEVVAPRASAKPPPRDYNELFASHDSDNSSPAAPAIPALQDRSASPHKHSAGIALKGGAGRNYLPSRLFDNDENSPINPSGKTRSTEHFYRPNPQKYQHFDFADDSDPQEAPKPVPDADAAKKTKHTSQWTFDDFVTPQKNIIPSKVLRGQEVRHWGTENDEVMESPIHREKVDKPRRDADVHFEFQDDGTPQGERRLIGRPRGAGANTGLGLYQNNLYDEDDNPEPPKLEHRGLGNLANIKDRRKDFDPHFTMTDDSPAPKEPKLPEKLPEDKAKVVKMMDANWASYDRSPSVSQKENEPMASTNSPSRPVSSKGPLWESTNTMSNRNDHPKGISIGGDGMGGKKGAGRAWGIGDDSDGEETGGLNAAGSRLKQNYPGKKQGTNVQTQTGGDFWNF